MKFQDWTKIIVSMSFALILASCESPTPKGETGEGTNIDTEGDVAGTQEGDMGVPEADRLTSVDHVKYGKWENIHFDYDSAVIRAEDRPILEEIAKWMKENPTQKVMVAGNCDERGTLEYNRALGQRRAQAAREYLIKLGAHAGNIGTVSWGEDRPLIPGHNDEAWAKNRRDEFGIAE